MTTTAGAITSNKKKFFAIYVTTRFLFPVFRSFILQLILSIAIHVTQIRLGGRACAAIVFVVVIGSRSGLFAAVIGNCSHSSFGLFYGLAL